jgi:hypothetical protein
VHNLNQALNLMTITTIGNGMKTVHAEVLLASKDNVLKECVQSVFVARCQKKVLT